jgi:hypothetical protein
MGWHNFRERNFYVSWVDGGAHSETALSGVSFGIEAFLPKIYHII